MQAEGKHQSLALRVYFYMYLCSYMYLHLLHLHCLGRGKTPNPCMHCTLLAHVLEVLLALPGQYRQRKNSKSPHKLAALHLFHCGIIMVHAWYCRTDWAIQCISTRVRKKKNLNQSQEKENLNQSQEKENLREIVLKRQNLNVLKRFVSTRTVLVRFSTAAPIEQSLVRKERKEKERRRLVGCSVETWIQIGALFSCSVLQIPQIYQTFPDQSSSFKDSLDFSNLF